MFKSTKNISSSSNTFKNIIKVDFIKNVKNDVYSFSEAIFFVWQKKYKNPFGKILDTFDTNISLKTTGVAKELRPLINKMA